MKRSLDNIKQLLMKRKGCTASSSHCQANPHQTGTKLAYMIDKRSSNNVGATIHTLPRFRAHPEITFGLKKPLFWLQKLHRAST
jgi:hypothetical protein